MSSNELATMSHPHTLDGVVNGDVSNGNNSQALSPIAPPAPQTEYPADFTVVETREISKSVVVSAGKRRKVSTTKTSNAPAERKTRSRVGTSHSLNPIKPPVPKYKSANQIKEATKSQRQKTMHKTFERHDTKLRELFHLTKFVTLVDYDAKTAKEDQSEVFEEFKAPYELWQKAADAKTGGRVRSTRHAISTQRDVLGPAFTQPSPKLTSATAKSLHSSVAQTRPKRSLGGDAPNYAMPKRRRRSSASIQPVENGVVSKVHKRKASNDKLFGSFTENLDISVTRSPRFKLKYRAPEPLITHPLHLPLSKQFNSLGEYLDSYIQLDDHEDTTLEKAQQKALHEASIRNRIDVARARGWLAGDSASPTAPRKQSEPSTAQTRHDVMLKHVLNFSTLMAQERRSNISRAKKIAQMVAQHFKKLEGTDEKEIKAEDKRIRRLAKWTAQEVRKKWKLAERVVKQRRAAMFAEQQRLRGKQHLNQILEHSTQLLEARRAARNSASVEPSTPRDTESLLYTEDEVTDTDESMEHEVSSDEDSEMEDTISESSEDEEDNNVGDDANLTVEELRQKYAEVIDKEPSGSLVNEIIGSDDEDGEEMDVQNEEIVQDVPNGDYSVDVDTTERPNGLDYPSIPEDTVADDNSIFDEDEDEADSPMDSEEDEEGSELDDETDEDIPSLGKLLGGWYSDDPAATVSDEEELDTSVAEESVQGVVDGVNDNMDEEEAKNDIEMVEAVSDVESTSSVGDEKAVQAHTKIPFLLHGQLREYQHIGLDWLASLYDNNTNGILADEMGLGKTIQTIALIAHLACEKHVWGPHLVVVPTSVILNWEMEFKKWAPGFKILTYYGDAKQREQKRKGWNKQDTWHVCITSYQLVIHDQQIFRRKRWEYMILDEAHNIKNFRSQRWQTLLNFNANHRLLLTGTPLQNNLVELWSLLYFLMPQGISSSMPAGFANLKEFQEWFANPVDKIIQSGAHIVDDEARNTVAKLHGVLRPYLLRRLKQDVEKQMPAKYEHVVYCRLSKRQRYLYDDFMSRAQTKETLASGNFMSIINCLMQLRKVCNHPDLFETRPIVTSFAMPRSCVTDYEKTEDLIRSRLLQKHPLEYVDLETVNLRFTHHEQMSGQSADQTLRLSASPSIARACDELEEAVKEVISPDFTTLEGHAKYMDYEKKLSRLDRLQHIGYLSDLRCKRRPVYGSRILEVCDQFKTVGSKQVPPLSPRTTDDYLETSDIIASMVMDVQRRFKSVEPAIDKFAVVTPPIVTLDFPSLMFSSLDPAEIKATKTTYADLSFPIRTRLSIAFPDKRLLQYDCGKLQRLDGLLRDLIDGGHRALIFTQMTRVLDILEIFLNFHGYRYLRLDGATKIEQRQIMTERFNSDNKIPVFILSSRSGGLGINLTGADTVIFYDSDWNPCMDKQCQDRCHRIGQTRDVHIYRFVSEFTIEENIFRKANQKRLLDNVVITEGNFTSDFFNKVDWRDMLGDDIPLPLIPEHTAGDVGHGARVEQAFAAAEDMEDAIAAKRAQKEMEVDAVEFAEVPTPVTPATPLGVTPVGATPAGATPVGGAASSTPAPAGSASDRELSISTPDVVAPTPSVSGMEIDVPEEVEPGSVDDWMIMFIERERLDLDEVK